MRCGGAPSRWGEDLAIAAAGDRPPSPRLAVLENGGRSATAAQDLHLREDGAGPKGMIATAVAA